MVDTDDTRRTTDDGRRTTDAGRRTTPRVWHKLPTGELKNRWHEMAFTRRTQSPPTQSNQFDSSNVIKVLLLHDVYPKITYQYTTSTHLNEINHLKCRP